MASTSLISQAPPRIPAAEQPARPGRTTDLLPSREATRRLQPFARGTRPPGDSCRQIVVTDSRGADFDRDLSHGGLEIGPRWRSVEAAFRKAASHRLVVYKLGDAYFIIDGHHQCRDRPRQSGRDDRRRSDGATARRHLPADADLRRAIYAEQERIFMEEAGWARLGPMSTSGSASRGTWS